MISQLSEVEVAIALHLLKQNLRGKYLDEALKRASPGKKLRRVRVPTHYKK